MVQSPCTNRGIAYGRSLVHVTRITVNGKTSIPYEISFRIHPSNVNTRIS